MILQCKLKQWQTQPINYRKIRQTEYLKDNGEEKSWDN